MFECVINVSEGHDEALLRSLEQAAGPSFADRHSDGDHHRSVFTLINEAPALLRDVRALLTASVAAIDLTHHQGVHPRLGAVDVVPFVPLAPHTLDDAVVLRDELADWVGETMGLPVFLYGPLGSGERSLPFVRKHGFVDLWPDRGPQQPDPRSGAITVGARPLLLAWNLWLSHTSLERTKELATALRQPGVRTLGLQVGRDSQVSCNVIDVDAVALSALYDQVASSLQGDEQLLRGELVGLAPQRVLDRNDSSRWAQLGLDPDATIEARLAQRTTTPERDAQ